MITNGRQQPSSFIISECYAQGDACGCYYTRPRMKLRKMKIDLSHFIAFNSEACFCRSGDPSGVVWHRFTWRTEVKIPLPLHFILSVFLFVLFFFFLSCSFNMDSLASIKTLNMPTPWNWTFNCLKRTGGRKLNVVVSNRMANVHSCYLYLLNTLLSLSTTSTHQYEWTRVSLFKFPLSKLPVGSLRQHWQTSPSQFFYLYLFDFQVDGVVEPIF